MDTKHQNGHTNGKTNGCSKEESDLYRIEVPSDNPFDLFKKWYQDAQDAGLVMPHALNLATSDGEGRVSARTLLMRRLLDDGFLIMTDGRSKKSFDLTKNPRVAITFLWMYPRSPKGTVARQVRVEGFISEKSFDDEHIDLYTSEPLFCKIRSKICRQGERLDWEEHKKRHDAVYKQCQQEGSAFIDMPPPHYKLYKVHPEMMDFYMATESTVGDRVVFRPSEQSHLIPTEALADPLDELAATFRNGLKIATGTGHVETRDGPLQWVHYNVSA